jgi:hypothetical protein
MININQSDVSVFMKQIRDISVALRARANEVLLLQQHSVPPAAA